ncbi:siderophore-interacting protein [Ochrobactrum sp. RH2CCR150]|uniref:siderophore-interacting protein n=1 Tax=Ochrobactrum sp. RH2CCR150 TaxID=2587044 RepID=UPI0017FF3125|nr:NADPH-dependent ferric siderophore reductase [Ochrobactrum sp. RH2CCR150]
MTLDYFSATVKHREAITPSMVRVVLEGADLHRFQSTGRPDEFIWLSFPAADHGEEMGRYYTVRRWDAIHREITIDFVIHEIGIATNWAQRVLEGDQIKLLPPRFRFNPPSDTQFILLIADITGLPAVGRILEQLPAGFKAIVHVAVPFDADRQIIATTADVCINWYFWRGPKHNRSLYTELPRIAESITSLPAGPGYVWIAGEAMAVSKSRKYFRDEFGFEKDQITAVGYWIEGQARV